MGGRYLPWQCHIGQTFYGTPPCETGQQAVEARVCHYSRAEQPVRSPPLGALPGSCPGFGRPVTRCLATFCRLLSDQDARWEPVRLLLPQWAVAHEGGAQLRQHRASNRGARAELPALHVQLALVAPARLAASPTGDQSQAGPGAWRDAPARREHRREGGSQERGRGSPVQRSDGQGRPEPGRRLRGVQQHQPRARGPSLDLG